MFSFSFIICGYTRARRKCFVAFDIQRRETQLSQTSYILAAVLLTLSSFKSFGRKTQQPLTVSDLSQTSVYAPEVAHCTSVWVYSDRELRFVKHGHQCMLILTHDINIAGCHSIRSSYTRMENDMLGWRGFNGIKSMCRRLVPRQILL